MKLPRKVYVIRHNVTNRVYVGSSYNLNVRIKNHLQRLRSHSHNVEDMQTDFDRYGEDYSIEIVDEILHITDSYKEYEWMEKYQSRIRGIGYNYLDTQGKSKKRASIFLTLDSNTLSMSEWAEKVNIPYSVLYDRIYQRNWDVRKALLTPKGKRGV